MATARAAARIALTDDDRERLVDLSRRGQVGLALRARIVLLAADGLTEQEIATQLKSTKPIVRNWLSRFDVEGVDGLRNKPGSGRPRKVDDAEPSPEQEERNPVPAPRTRPSDQPSGPDQPVDGEEPEGLDPDSESWGDYPLDELLIRHETRTIHDVIRRIEKSRYVMDPDFQRDFIWPDDKQSKLIESVIMRIPLPVFYLAEDDEGRMVVVDGLQRLSTFRRFLKNELRLRLPDRSELDGKRFADLPPKLQNRVEDCNLIFYLIDSKVPERARLDIFERVNGGVPLTRQQMRNSLFMGASTRFLKDESKTEIFLQATGKSLNTKTMRDREFVNRFCAFQLLDVDDYRGDMDDFLAKCLRRMNKMKTMELSRLSEEFHRGLTNNFMVFGRHAFRKHGPESEKRSRINASFWDVMSTGLSRYTRDRVEARAEHLRDAIHDLFTEKEFNTAITYSTNHTRNIRYRFERTHGVFEEVLGAHTD